MQPAKGLQMIEKRFNAGGATAKQRRLAGYAARFNTPARIGDFTETIAPGAFRKSLETRADVLALKDHDTGVLLGRVKSGTLRLSEDASGLAFEIDMPQTSVANDLLELASRGDLSGMSFGFRVRPGGEQWSADRTKRTLTDLDLIEISVASAFAAYPTTEVHARSRSEAEDDPWLVRIRLMEREAGLV